jgi:hypothetical protein
LATGAFATQRIAKATGDLPATIFRTARMLREHDPAFWPEAGKGGGHAAAHVTQRHLVNLALALAVGEPRLAVKAIPIYREMIADKPARHAPTQGAGLAANLLANNDLFKGTRCLGDELQRLLTVLLQGDIATVLESAGLYFEFFIEGRVPRVVVGHHQFDALGDLDKPHIRWLYRRPHMTHANEFDPNRNYLPRMLITRTTLLPVSLFTVLAELWVDTQEYQAKQSTRRIKPTSALIEE